jgi:hypothetical protein
MANKNNPYLSYYIRQAGGNFDPVVFKGNKYQRGRGFGNFFSGLFRRITPFLKTVGLDIGRQLLSTGTHLLDDAVQGRNMKEAASQRFRDTGKTLVSNSMKTAREQMGLGKRRAKRRKRVSPVSKRGPALPINTGLGVKRKSFKPSASNGKKLKLRDLFG